MLPRCITAQSKFIGLCYFFSRLGCRPERCLLLKAVPAIQPVWNKKLLMSWGRLPFLSFLRSPEVWASQVMRKHWSFSWNPCQPGHWGVLVLPATAWRHKAANSSFTAAFSHYAVFFLWEVSQFYWAELFQEALGHVLGQYLAVIISICWGVEVPGRWHKASEAAVLVGCTIGSS